MYFLLSGMTYHGKNKPSIMKKLAVSVKNTWKCIPIGTLETIIVLGLRKRNENETKLMIQVRLTCFLFTFYSGMLCPRSNRPSIMLWQKRRDKYICNYIQAGQPGTTMPNTKRNVEKETKLEQTTKVSFVYG